MAVVVVGVLLFRFDLVALGRLLVGPVSFRFLLVFFMSISSALGLPLPAFFVLEADAGEDEDEAGVGISLTPAPAS